MAKGKIWLPILLVVILALGGYYYYKTYWQLPSIPANFDGWQQVGNNTTSSQSTGGTAVVAGDVDNIVAGVTREATAEQTDGATNAGESALVNFVSQRVNDLSQSYDENQF